jgi:hypothetical protein
VLLNDACLRVLENTTFGMAFIEAATCGAACIAWGVGQKDTIIS